MMLAFKFDGDLIEGLIILVVVIGSALSGVAKSIITKMNDRKREQADAEKDLMTTSPPAARPMTQPVSRPVARPMPPRRPVRTTVESPERDVVELEVPEAVRPLVEMLLGRTSDDEDVVPPPPPRPVPAPPPARPATPGKRAERRPRPAPRVEVGRSDLGDTQRMEQIRRREEAQAQRSEKRIGHVETHVAPALGSSEPIVRSRLAIPTDRNSLRRAIVLNEILGPPVSLRTSESF
jgi:hypothetical protein